MACGAWAVGRTQTIRNRLSLSQAAVDLGCNFFDTAYAYGEGRSENLLGQLVRAQSREETLHGHENPADESRVASATRVHC